MTVSSKRIGNNTVATSLLSRSSAASTSSSTQPLLTDSCDRTTISLSCSRIASLIRLPELVSDLQILCCKPAPNALLTKISVEAISKCLILCAVADEARVELNGLPDTRPEKLDVLL